MDPSKDQCLLAIQTKSQLQTYQQYLHTVVCIEFTFKITRKCSCSIGWAREVLGKCWHFQLHWGRLIWICIGGDLHICPLAADWHSVIFTTQHYLAEVLSHSQDWRHHKYDARRRQQHGFIHQAHPISFSGRTICPLIQRASEADYQSCSIEISDIYKYVYVRQNISPALLIT